MALNSVRRPLSTSLLVSTLICMLAGCGAIENVKLTQGNWSVTATSSTPANGTFYVGGSLTQSGDTLSGKMHIVNSLCFDVSTPVDFHGKVKGRNVTLTSTSVNSQVITINGTGTSSEFSGTYSLTGGTCAAGDKGTISSNAVPSITGTWSGPIAGSGGSAVTLSTTLTQAAAASADGTFAVSGAVAYTGSSCSVDGTITSGFVVGPYLQLNGTTVETDGSAGSFTYAQVLLDSQSAPKSMTGTYEVVAGLCGGDIDAPTLAKQ